MQTDLPSVEAKSEKSSQIKYCEKKLRKSSGIKILLCDIYDIDYDESICFDCFHGSDLNRRDRKIFINTFPVNSK